MLSLLQTSGFSIDDYAQRFKSVLLEELPQLALLEKHQLATIDDSYIRLNENGIAYSDLIGSWLFTENIRSKMQGWEWQ